MAKKSTIPDQANSLQLYNPFNTTDEATNTAHLDTHNRYRKLVELLALKNDDRRKLQNNPPSGYV